MEAKCVKEKDAELLSEMLEDSFFDGRADAAKEISAAIEEAVRARRPLGRHSPVCGECRDKVLVELLGSLTEVSILNGRLRDMRRENAWHTSALEGAEWIDLESLMCDDKKMVTRPLKSHKFDIPRFAMTSFATLAYRQRQRSSAMRRLSTAPPSFTLPRTRSQVFCTNGRSGFPRRAGASTRRKCTWRRTSASAVGRLLGQ